jgi:hypothetical protein
VRPEGLGTYVTFQHIYLNTSYTGTCNVWLSSKEIYLARIANYWKHPLNFRKFYLDLDTKNIDSDSSHKTFFKDSRRHSDTVATCPSVL